MDGLWPELFSTGYACIRLCLGSSGFITNAEYIDVDSGDILDVYASRDRGLARALTFLRTCEVIVVDRCPWYPLGISYFHQTFGERNRVERWFRTLKDRTIQQHKLKDCGEHRGDGHGNSANTQPNAQPIQMWVDIT